MIDWIDLIVKGGIVGIDGAAIAVVLYYGRFYLTNTPDEKDYLFTPKSKREEYMRREVEAWRETGTRLIVAAIPIIVISILIVCVVMVAGNAN